MTHSSEFDQSWLTHVFPPSKEPLTLSTEDALTSLHLLVLESRDIVFSDVFTHQITHRFPILSLISIQINLFQTQKRQIQQRFQPRQKKRRDVEEQGDVMGTEVTCIKLVFKFGNSLREVIFAAKKRDIWKEIVLNVCVHPKAENIPSNMRPGFTTLRLLTKLNVSCDQFTVIQQAQFVTNVLEGDRQRISCNDVNGVKNVVLQLSHQELKLKRNTDMDVYGANDGMERSGFGGRSDIFSKELCYITGIDWSETNRLLLSFETDSSNEGTEVVSLYCFDAYQLQEVVLLLLARTSYQRLKSSTPVGERVFDDFDVASPGPPAIALEQKRDLPQQSIGSKQERVQSDVSPKTSSAVLHERAEYLEPTQQPDTINRSSNHSDLPLKPGFYDETKRDVAIQSQESVFIDARQQEGSKSLGNESKTTIPGSAAHSVPTEVTEATRILERSETNFPPKKVQESKESSLEAQSPRNPSSVDRKCDPLPTTSEPVVKRQTSTKLHPQIRKPSTRRRPVQERRFDSLEREGVSDEDVQFTEVFDAPSARAGCLSFRKRATKPQQPLMKLNQDSARRAARKKRKPMPAGSYKAPERRSRSICTIQ